MFGCFLNLLMYFKVSWFFMIPKWLIKVPGHIAILFRWFLELPHSWFFWSRSGPLHLFFITKILQKIHDEIIIHKYYFSYINFLELRFFKFETTRPHFVWYFCGVSSQKKLGISERVQRFVRAWNLGICGQSNFENIKT